MNEEERLVRLFVVVNKSMTESELKDHFSEFGDIDYVSIVRDRNTKESKGFAYVKYHRMSHAAKAFEECDRNFKPVFADPKPQKSGYHDGGSGTGSNGPSHVNGPNNNNGPGSTASGSTSASISASFDMLSYMDTTQSNPDGICRLTVSASSSVNQDQIWRLFDLVPGLDFCDRARSGQRDNRNNRGMFIVVYNNPQSATYAKEKLHGFEYPPGHRIVVRYDENHPHFHSSSQSSSSSSSTNFGRGLGHAPHFGAPPPLPRPMMPPPPPVVNTSSGRPNFHQDLAHLTETIANATALLQAAGYAPPTTGAPTPTTAPGTAVAPNTETYDPSYCSVKLPPPQPLAAMDSPVAERLFIVCTPVPPPELYALKDVFGRFGNLIDVYMLNGKSCGYAKYASKDSADRAVSALHGQEICGSRLKVMRAEPQEKSAGSGNDAAAGRKRQKIDDRDN